MDILEVINYIKPIVPATVAKMTSSPLLKPKDDDATPVVLDDEEGELAVPFAEWSVPLVVFEDCADSCMTAALTPVLLTHWLDGRTVALDVNTMSAHWISVVSRHIIEGDREAGNPSACLGVSEIPYDGLK